MRRSFLVFFLLASGAALARAESSSDFPQTQGQSSQGIVGGGSQFVQVRPAQNGGGGDWGANPAAYGGAQRQPDNGPTPQSGGPPQQQGPGFSGGRNPSKEDRQARNKSDNAEGDPGQDQAAGEESRGAPMDLDGARVNFQTVVDAYVAKRKGDKDYWLYAPAKRGAAVKSWRLTTAEVDEDSVRTKGSGRFSARVKLANARGGRPLKLEFVVDFSGEKWKVVSVKPPDPPRQ